MGKRNPGQTSDGVSHRGTIGARGKVAHQMTYRGPVFTLGKHCKQSRKYEARFATKKVVMLRQTKLLAWWRGSWSSPGSQVMGPQRGHKVVHGIREF